MLLFTVESAFRAIYSATFTNDPPFTFSKLYKKLLPAFGLDKYTELLKLASLNRNTLHNGGLYTSNDDTCTWRNKTYQFKKDQHVELGDVWQTLIIIAEDIFDMLKELVTNNTSKERNH